MRAIRSFGNRTTELRLKAILVRRSITGWKLHPKDAPGNADFYFPEKRVAIFVDGCFFHGCPRCGHTPRTNRTYWAAKIARNKRRDTATSRTLRALGYRVTRIWECQLREHPNRCLSRILRTTKLG
jgi:DNA mismatch endonuclease (patch repair protein)